jgi:GNAT superfamily N-acetyltransferase
VGNAVTRDEPDDDRPTPDDVSIRTATPDDELGVRRVVDAALLDVPPDLDDRIASGRVLVAVTDAGTVVGALTHAPSEDSAVDLPSGGPSRSTHVDAVAVARNRRSDGIGSALVRRAAGRTERPLTATFRSGVRPFYEELGFEIQSVCGEQTGPENDDDRLLGTLP